MPGEVIGVRVPALVGHGDELYTRVDQPRGEEQALAKFIAGEQLP